MYQSVFSFLNRFGGDIYLGVEDDGTVCGVPENAAGDMVKLVVQKEEDMNQVSVGIWIVG